MGRMEILGGETLEDDSPFGNIPRPRIPEPERARKAMMVLRSYQEISPGAVVCLVARPQCAAFRVGRVAIPDDVAKYFDICDMRVGNRSQIMQAGSFRATYFAAHIERLSKITAQHIHNNEMIELKLDEATEEEFGRDYNFDTCQCAMDFSFIVESTGKVPMKFEAWLLGKATW